MRKTILAVYVVVIFTTPCIAQEIEPEGLSWIHGTVWRKVGVWKSYLDESGEMFGIERGFYSGNVYDWAEGYCRRGESYYDLLIFSFYKYDISWWGYRTWYTMVEEGILFPLIGVGFVQVREHELECEFMSCSEGWYDPYYIPMIKVNNWWNPSTDCPELFD